jgi:RNA polymerase sigma-70 factor, ECF subfamily
MRNSFVSLRVDERVEAIERIYHDRYTSFRYAVTAVLGDFDRAHDAVQDGFAQALLRRGDFRGGSLEAWVWRIVVRKALDLRRGDRKELLETEIPGQLIASDADTELAAAIRSLPARRRLIVFLRYFADLSYEQIAELCGISPGTVAATLSQAHTELRELLELERVKR